MITYIDLFAGAGGLSEGFTATGFHPVAHVEMNKEACNTLKTRACYYYLKNSGKLDIYRKYLQGMIDREEFYSSVPSYVINSVINQTMADSSMPDLFHHINRLMAEQKIEKIDLLVGGPPCQAYSLVGRAVKNDGMVNDPRNYLYKLYIKVLKEYHPKMFVFENVPGLLTASKGKYLHDMEIAFDESGYEIQYKVLNSSDFGVLQNRHRVIIVGWEKGSEHYYPVFAPQTNKYTVQDILGDLPTIQSGEERNEYKDGEYSRYLAESGIRKDNDILTWHVSRPNIERDRAIYRKVIETWNTEKRRIKYTELPEQLCTHNNREHLFLVLHAGNQVIDV